MTEPRDPRDPNESIAPSEPSEPRDARAELDALLSAQRDGALEPGDEARLVELLAADPATRLRRVHFERFDATLRGFGMDPIPQARLDRIEAELRRRLEASGIAGAAADAAVEARALRRRRLGLGLAAALAAGVVLASVVWAPRDEHVADETRADETPIADQAPRDVDDLASLGIEEASDLEVIEELELLEFLAARERDAGEPEG